MKNTILICTFFIASISISTGQKRKLNVAIFVHEGVELFDFAGPGEVFASANYFTDVVNFNVYTVAPTEEEVVSQTFLKINPNYSIKNCPKPDIIVLPGGNTGIPMRNEEVMSWIKENAESTNIMLSVCTGAFLLAKAGLLNGLRATTHHSSIEGLRNYSDKIIVLEDTKFIDNDRIITSGGVSSGTEGSLHVISRIAGSGVAQKVARYMEYDHWNEEIGVVDKVKSGLDQILTASSNSDKQMLIEMINNIEGGVFYGELDKIAIQLSENGQYAEASKIFKINADRYPSYDATLSLITIYEQSGQPVPLKQEDFEEILDEEGFDEMVKVLKEQQIKFPGLRLFKSRSMYRLGSSLMQEEKYDQAIIAFTLNTDSFPESWYNYNKLGEIYSKLGKHQLARDYYAKSLEINPDDDQAKKMLASLK